jgi:haloacid dehalogenase-like hydrolase/AAA domain
MIKSTIGLYGISGSGKSWHLARLRKLHPEWSCVEGSQVISEILGERGADLKTFSVMNADEKLNIRDLAISRIQQRPGVTVVAGHCSFPKVPTKNSPPGHPLTFDDVFTQGDAETYQAVLYLDRSAHDVLAQRLRDNSTETRLRSCLSLEEIDQWIQHEKVVLQRECSKHGLDFFLVRDADDPAKHISEHILDPLFADAERRSIASLKSAVQDIPDADVYLLLDGDRTLCPEDTGTQFFHQIDGDGATLKKIHQCYPKYSFRAFLETAMLYATVADYKLISSRTAENVEMYSEWVSFLSQLPPKVHAVLVSSGNREIWQAVLRQHDLIGNAESTDISIIAGNHVSLHSYVVDDAAKELVVTELRKRSGGSRIMAFGDSGKC